MTTRSIVNEIVSNNFSVLDSILSSNLQKKANDSGWPEEIAKSLYVENGEIQYPEEYTKQIEDLEYGTPSSAPSPFLRTHKENKTYNEIYENIIIELLFESGVVF